MKKKDTRNEHKQRINEVQYHINKYLFTKLTIEDLAKISSYSIFHFQRIFKEITSKSVVNYIKDLRLECAANFLVFNPDSTITDIAYSCGFKSSATFSNEFKKQYNCSPTQWRKTEYKNYHQSNKYNLNDKDIDFSQIEIKKLPEVKIAYMRHMGFDKTIKTGWQKFLYLLEKDFGIVDGKMMAVHHSNPNITSLEDYRYVACVDLENRNITPKGDIGLCSISGGLFATIRFQGVCEDALILYKKIYYEWLPSSEYEALETSASVLYYKNNYLDEKDEFDIEFRVPIKYK
ncbi:AraC family transcriptional regulator [Campylobacterota bacterium DY0563]